jgi:hypothetical protein
MSGAVSVWMGGRENRVPLQLHYFILRRGCRVKSGRNGKINDNMKLVLKKIYIII